MGNETTRKIRKAVKKLCKHQEEHLELYRQTKNRNFYLGRLFGLGNWFQLFLAEALFKNNNRYSVLIDCPVTIKNRTQPLYPDILIVDKAKNKLKGLIDVKLDLGYINTKEYGLKKVNSKKRRSSPYKYSRTGNNFRRKYNVFFKAKEFKYNLKNEQHEIEDVKSVNIPKRVRKISIVLMGHVNHHGRYDEYKKAMKDSGFKFLHILWDGNVRDPHKDNKKIAEEISYNNEIEKAFKPFFGLKKIY